jgi:serine/threonine protein kinase
MPWPMASDFSAIVQQPRFAFRDPALQACTIERNALGQPIVRSGAFAVVYRGTDTDGRSWALRAFTTKSRERREHYEQITAHLRTQQPRCLVDFEYRESSIRSAGDGKWYPLVVMDWVRGMTLFSWLRSKCRRGRGASIAKAARHWLRLVGELRDVEIVHGDLQHANIMVTPEGRLKLVDYDGMCVPALIGRRNLEIGVRPYQHPQRNESTLLQANLDDFSALVIYVALRALAADSTLWARYVGQSGYDKLLFRSEDYLDRERSPLYRDLMESADSEVRTLAAQLFSFARGSIDDVLPLHQLVAVRSGGKRAAASAVPDLPWQSDRSEPPPADKPASRVILDIVTGPLQGEKFCIDRHDAVLFGRGADCHLRVADDRRISRHQFLLEAIPPHARLRELGSRNGTYVNGVKYGGRQQPKPSAQSPPEEELVEVDLKHGDQISAGGTTLLLRVEGAPPSPGPRRPSASSAAPRPEPQEPAERLIDRLAVHEEMGSGALGVVYRAESREDHRQLALKIIQPQTEIGQSNRNSVLSDLQSLKSLHHANIVGLIECGTLRRAFYFITEYCDGGSLEAWMAERGGKLILGQARPLMFQCLDGLEHAHRQGLVHGDLKPQNILLHRDRHKRIARIADFGLARILRNAGWSGMTATGEVSRNLHYLPRERLVGLREGDARSDQWSLAAAFYHMLTGQYPRDLAGRDPIAVILHSETIPIGERNTKIPKPVAGVIDRALASEADKRFRDTAQMKTHLKHAFAQVRG